MAENKGHIAYDHFLFYILFTLFWNCRGVGKCACEVKPCSTFVCLHHWIAEYRSIKLWGCVISWNCVWYVALFNLQTTVQGPMDPAAFSTRSQKVITGISKPMFHLILLHIEPFCCIKWYLVYDAPAHAKASHSINTQKYLGSNGPCHLFHVTGLKRN